MKEENFNQLINKIKSKKVPFSAIFGITNRCNLRCLHCYQELGVKFQASFMVFPSRHPHRSPEQFRLKAEEIKTYLRRDRNFGNKSREKEESSTREFICNAEWEACCVGANGRVYPCVALRWERSDLNKNSFVEVWNRSPTPPKIRSYKEEDFKVCFGCKWKVL